jgi:hypothetical protein
MEQEGVSVLQRSQPNIVEQKIRGLKLRSAVFWQGALRKGVKRGSRVHSRSVSVIQERMETEHTDLVHVRKTRQMFYYDIVVVGGDQGSEPWLLLHCKH